MSQDQRDIYMGGPYAFYAQGQIARGKTGDGSVNTFSKTMYGPQSWDFTLEGWATANGKFDGAQFYIAASAPAWSNSKGMVWFYNNRLSGRIVTRLIGEANGDCFGHSLAAGDVDGDGASDLVVGAPLAQAPNQMVDHGRAYVHYAPARKVSVRPRLVLVGKDPWGRFGHTVSSPGDLNQDGYDDVVIGAPFGDEGGVVYVYNGGANGLGSEHTQKISASHFSVGLRSFGFSIDGGIDVDANGFPDLIVGAPESDAAVFIRTAPVVRLEGSIEFEPRVISMGKKSCRVGGQDVVCFNVSINLQHRTKNVLRPMPMQLSFELDPKYRRFAFKVNDDYRCNVTRDVSSVTEHVRSWFLEAYVKEGRPRLDVPLRLATNVSLVPPAEEPLHLTPERKPVPSILHPLSSQLAEARARLECEDIATCYSKPDLVLENRYEELTVNERNMEVEVRLQVLHAIAYSVSLEATHPSVLTFSHVSGDRFLPKCRESPYVSDVKQARQICSYNELRKNMQINMTFHFEYNPMTLLTYDKRHLNLSFVAASDIGDRNEEDNSFNISVPIVSRVDLYAEGVSAPDNVEARINETLSLREIVNPPSQEAINRTQLGPQTTHRFTVTNRGPSPLIAAQMLIQVPLATRSGLPLLYLVENPLRSPSLSCSSPPLNPKGFNFTSDRRRDNKESLVQGQVTTTASSSRGAPTPIETSPASTTAGRSRRRVEDRVDDDDDLPEVTTPSPPTKEDAATAKPSISTEEPTLAADADKRTMMLDCNAMPCQVITCNVTSLLPDETVYLQFTTYITTATIKFMRFTSVALESSLILHTNQPNVTVSHGGGELNTSTANTHVTLIERRESQASIKDVSLWKIFIAVLGGLMLLIVLIAILHKLGFFKRKRLDSTQKEILKESQKRRTQYLD
ncbi:integrin alpha pat-2-like [Penaeus japonicus]|uniref:integrin alpha pat-2-like n=1 Tax=Penaeus japonicus TaxID=27405 RepID=UPI001C70F475|nr:integrin alpha pat-2-like [Penaeus japonicus]